ncbi:MAG: DUF393 domain-containing protein [Fimbriimonadales bacterium]|nr:DUF393 domain-containing protein [Fimbriimonadales bacterium]
MSAQARQHWLLWDGECRFCAWAVAWVQRHDQAGRFLITPYQQAPEPLLSPEQRAACRYALHVITAEGHILRAGRAVLFIGEQLGYRWLTRLLGYPPFIWLVEAGYWLVARLRCVASCRRPLAAGKITPQTK